MLLTFEANKLKNYGAKFFYVNYFCLIGPLLLLQFTTKFSLAVIDESHGTIDKRSSAGIIAVLLFYITRTITRTLFRKLTIVKGLGSSRGE